MLSRKIREVVIDYYLSLLSANEDAAYMYGVCAHGLGLLREAVHAYDHVLNTNSTHYVFYLRHIAMLQHENLDTPLSTFNLDHKFDRGKGGIILERTRKFL